MSSRRAALEVHEWRGTFRGEPASFKMTSVIGHVYSLDFPPAYNSWDRVDPLELFDAATVKSESNPKVQPGSSQWYSERTTTTYHTPSWACAYGSLASASLSEL